MIYSLKNYFKSLLFSPEFIGHYTDFDNIKFYDNYDNDKVANNYVRLAFSNSRLKKNIIYTPGLTIIHNQLLNSNKEVRILDLGGGIGTIYNFLITQKPGFEENTKITLFETKSMISEIKKYVKKNNIDVKMFLTSVLPKDKFDIIYVGSSLQYFKNYKKILEYISEYSDNIVMDEIPVSNKNTFANLQVNLRPLKLPAWVFSQEEIINYFEKKEWKVSYLYRSPRTSIHKNSPYGMQRSGISIHLQKEII